MGALVSLLGGDKTVGLLLQAIKKIGIFILILIGLIYGFSFIKWLKNKLVGVGSKIDHSQLAVMANRLEAAMNGAGTDEQTIFEILVPLSYYDYSALKAVFGERTYYLIAEDLNYWLREELTTDEKTNLIQLNKIYASEL